MKFSKKLDIAILVSMAVWIPLALWNGATRVDFALMSLIAVGQTVFLIANE